MEEFANRVEKAHNWLEGPFVRNFTQYAGTAEDPLLALAAQGHTFRDPAELKELVHERGLDSINSVREAYGFNPQGTLQEKLGPLEAEYSKLYTDYQDRLNAQQDRYNELSSNGMADPYQDPQLAKFKAANEKIGNKVKALGTQFNNLKTGQAYETISDSSVRPMSAMDMWKSIRPEERQFYPNLERIKNDDPYQLVYSMNKANVNVSGMPVVGKQYIDDVLKGNIDPANTSIQAYVKRISEKRIQSQEAEKAALQQQKDTGLRALRNQMANTPGQKYDNAKAITIDNSLDPETIRKLLSAETEVLDHCVADIGGKPVNSKTLFKNEGIKRQRWPMYDLATGQLNRDDARPSSYMLGAERGNEKFISLRDVITGMPEGLIQFTHPYTDPSTNQKTYTIGYVSGFQNRSIDPKYKNALKAMFNDHADEIRDIGSHAEDSGIYDKDNVQGRQLTTRDNWEAVKDSLPRFFTKEDLKAEVAKIQQVATSQLAAASPAEISAIQDDVASAIETAISTAGAELEDRNLYREVDARLRQAYGEWAQQFPDNVFAQDPLRAVTNLQGRLDNMANTVPVALRGAFAEARDEVTAVLQGMQIPQRQVQAANAPMTVSDWVEQEIGRIGRADGGDISAEVRRFVDQATDFYNPDVNTQAFVNSIRGAAGLTDSSLVEENLNAIANYIEQTHIRPAQAQAPAQFDVGPIIMAAREAAQRDLTPDQWNTMVSLLERANNIADARQQPQSFADALNGLITLPSVTRLAGFDDRVARRLTGLVDNITNGITEFDRQQAPAQFDAGPIIMAARERAQRELTSSQWNLIVSFLERANNLADARHDPIGFADAVSSLADIADHDASTRSISPRLNQLADSIITAFNEFSQNLGEPEDLGAWEPEEQHAANQPSPTSIARHLVEIEREPDGTLRPQGITSTLQALRTGQLDHPSLAEHPPGSPERIAAGMRIAPIVESMAAQDFSYNTLHYFLSNEERNQINTDSSRIVRQAQSHGVDANETGSMIRRRNDIYGGATVNLDNYSPFALEVLRRDVVDSLNAAPQAPVVGQPSRVSDDNRADAADIMHTLEETMDDIDLSSHDRIAQLEDHIASLSRGVEGLEDIVPVDPDDWPNPPGLRDELMRLMQNEVNRLRRELGLDDDEEPQHFAKGGRVTHTPTVDSMRYELMMRRA